MTSEKASDDVPSPSVRRNPTITRVEPAVILSEAIAKPEESQHVNRAIEATTTTTGCICRAPGWCELHHCQKPEHWYHLCRTRSDYFRLWEEGRGPGQVRSTDPPMEPGLIAKAFNFGQAAVRHVRDGLHRVDDATYNKRLEICRSCASCDLVRMVCRERDCGCQLHVKARWRSESCPRGKWLATGEPASSGYRPE